MRYVIHSPAGLSELVVDIAARELADARVRHVDDSALVLDTGRRIRSADDVPYAKNVFLVHAQTRRGSLGASVAALAGALPPLRVGRPHGFRLMAHLDGRLVSLEQRPRRALERAVARATGLTVTPRGSCLEFWVIGRRELPVLYLAERLPGRGGADRACGALSAELSALLVAAGSPRPDDVFLDPFAGSGALVRARLRTPCREVVYNDLDPAPHRAAFPRRVRVLAEDARTLPSVATGTVDAVVTDPPWGEHGGVGDYRDFAAGMTASLGRVLRPGHGRAVVLVNRRNEAVLTEALDAAGLVVDGSYRLLVNGHPATAVRARA